MFGWTTGIAWRLVVAGALLIGEATSSRVVSRCLQIRKPPERRWLSLGVPPYGSFERWRGGASQSRPDTVDRCPCVGVHSSFQTFIVWLGR